MPVKNRFAELHADITAWRRDLHENPEILFETHRTSATVAEKLRSFGCDEVVEGNRPVGFLGQVDKHDAVDVLKVRIDARLDYVVHGSDELLELIQFHPKRVDVLVDVH